MYIYVCLRCALKIKLPQVSCLIKEQEVSLFENGMYSGAQFPDTRRQIAVIIYI